MPWMTLHQENKKAQANAWHGAHLLCGGIVVKCLFSFYSAIFHFLKASPFQFLFKIGCREN